MTPFPFAIVGFDLDGTAVDSSPDLTDAVNHALAQAGRAPLHIDEVKPMIGGGVRRLLKRSLEETGGCEPEEFDRLYGALLDYYDANLAVGTRPYPGFVEALDALAARGVTCAIVTNKFARFAEKLLAELGLRERFACVIGGDTLGNGLRKPDRAPLDAMVRACGGGRAAFVGDSTFDTEAARNAGLPCVAVSFGFPNQPVETLGADAVIDRYAELIPALERLGG